MSNSQAVRAGAARRAEIPLAEDLARLLEGDPAVYMKLDPEGALLSLKAPGRFATGFAEGVRWHRMAPEERRDLVLGWIRKAAAYSRSPRRRWGLHKPRPAP